jgi:ureidoglycolate hydrolase
LSVDDVQMFVACRSQVGAPSASRAGRRINYARDVWHYPLFVLEREGDFLIIDRKGPGNNLDEAQLREHAVLEPQSITSAPCGHASWV